MVQIDPQLWAQCQRITRLSGPVGRLPHLLGTINGVQIFLVNGPKIKIAARSKVNSKRGYPESDHMDFVDAGNTVEDPGLFQAVWGSPKPKGVPEQAYLDVACHPSEWQFDLYHELTEMPLMQRGMAYDSAHEKANAVEKAARLQVAGAQR